MNEIFKKIPTTMPVKTSQSFKEKRQLLLTEILSKWYMNKQNTKLQPSKNPHLIKNKQEDHDVVKDKLTKYQTQKVEWIVSIKCNPKMNPFCQSTHKFFKK